MPRPLSHKLVNENMSNMTRHVIIQWAKSSLKIKKSGLKNFHTPFHMISMSTKTCHDMSKCHAILSCQILTLMCAHVNVHPPMSLTNIPVYVLSIHVKFNHYKKTGSSGVKGRVRSYSIYIENLNLVRSVQRVSNPDQKDKFNHYKKTGSSGVKGRGPACAFYYVRTQPTHPRVPTNVCPRRWEEPLRG